VNQPMKQQEYFLLHWIMNRDLTTVSCFFGEGNFIIFLHLNMQCSAGFTKNFYMYIPIPRQNNIFRAIHTRL